MIPELSPGASDTLKGSDGDLNAELRPVSAAIVIRNERFIR
jgi:hypothetical protein